MSVYLDPMVDHGTRINGGGPLWCHMIADSREELVALGELIKLPRAWLQDRERYSYYDIGSGRKRKMAVASGAIECNAAEYVGHLRRIRRPVKLVASDNGVSR